MTREEIIKKFNEVDYIYVWAYAGKNQRQADWFYKIEKSKLTLEEKYSMFWYRWGWPGADYNDYYL